MGRALWSFSRLKDFFALSGTLPGALTLLWILYWGNQTRLGEVSFVVLSLTLMLCWTGILALKISRMTGNG